MPREGGKSLSLIDSADGAEPPRLRSLPSASRLLLAVGAFGLALSAVSIALWVQLAGPLAVESPLLWIALAAFWGGAYMVVYAREVRSISRALAASRSIEPFGIHIYWTRAPRKGLYGAGMEVRARSKDDRFPLEFAVFLNVGLLWDLHVMGVRCSWSCKESGVLLLAPKRSRFLGGETAESLSLPSQAEAALRGLLRRPDEHDGPEWGSPAGAHAKRALEEVAAESWLFGPEQPFVAFEAQDGAIEKFWPPLAARLADLDVESALDLVHVVRAFDRDAIASRSQRPTSSPSKARPPSSPRP